MRSNLKLGCDPVCVREICNRLMSEIAGNDAFNRAHLIRLLGDPVFHGAALGKADFVRFALSVKDFSGKKQLECLTLEHLAAQIKRVATSFQDREVSVFSVCDQCVLSC